MVKKSKIIVCIVIAIACVTCCFLPIVASADSYDDAIKTPCAPTLYGLYGNGINYSYSTSVGGFPSKIPSATGTTGTIYRYCYQTTLNVTRHPNLFPYDYNRDAFGFDKDSIYYGMTSMNVNTPSYTFACYDSSFNLFFDYVKIGTTENPGTEFYWSTVFIGIDYSVQFYNTDDDTIETHDGTLYYSDYVEMVNGVWSDGQFWINSQDFLEYVNSDYTEDRYPVLSVTLSGEYADADTAFVCYFRIDDASTYISRNTYRNNVLNLGYEYGLDVGYGMGYAYGYNTGDAEGYIRGYEQGKQDGYNDGYVSGEDVGYQTGFEDGSQIEEKGFFALISSSISGFLQFEVFEDFTIGTLLLICVAVPLFVWILKMLAGG